MKNVLYKVTSKYVAKFLLGHYLLHKVSSILGNFIGTFRILILVGLKFEHAITFGGWGGQGRAITL